jgi:hypothetical protein
MDPELQALQAELAALQSAINESAVAPTATEPTGYGLRQLAFDIPTGVAKAGAGLADVLSYPVVKGLEYAGAPVETFGLSKLLSAGAEAAAPTLGVRPDTAMQEAVSFLTPSPLSKAKLLSQAGTGLAAYLGSEAAQKAMPESPYAGLVGALAAPAVVSGAAKVASAIAPSLEDVGMGLQRKARGARASDYKLAKNAIIETVEGDTTTQLKKSFDNLIEKGTLGKSIDPESMYPKLQAAKEAAEDSIQSVLKGTEAKVGPVPSPSFDKTLEYVSKNIAANDVDKYLNEVISLQDALRREGKGSLVYLNQQKKIIGENWKNSPQSDPGFWRSLYRDMKGHIEKYAPEVKDLNKQKQDLIVVSPIIERGFKATGADYDIGKVQQLLNTTGGAGLAGGAILGTAAGNVSAGVLGALTLRALSTPKGQNLVGKSLTKIGKALSPNATTEDVAKAATSLMSKEEFAAAQPFVHGTDEAGIKAIEGYGGFIPKTVRYSVLGPGTIYAAKRNTWWFDPEKTAEGRMWELNKQVPVYLKPEAKIVNIKSFKDLDRLEKKLNLQPGEITNGLFYEPGMTAHAETKAGKIITSKSAKNVLKEKLAFKQKLVDAGIDAINIIDETNWVKNAFKKAADSYAAKVEKKNNASIWSEKTSKIDRKIYETLKDQFYKRDDFRQAFGGDQLAILNPKIAEPANMAYERLLKTNPQALAKITPEEFKIIPEATKEKLLRSGYISSKVAQESAVEPSVPEPIKPEATSTAIIESDPELVELQAELKSLQQMTQEIEPKESVKIGKQNISIPTGEEYAPASLVKAVMKVESGGKQEAVSPKGATGLMQLMPATAKELGVNPKNPEQNVEGGSRYLQRMLNKYDSQEIALAAYNWGPGNIDRAIRKVRAAGKRVTWPNILNEVRVPKETRQYVSKVTNLVA